MSDVQPEPPRRRRRPAASQGSGGDASGQDAGAGPSGGPQRNGDTASAVASGGMPAAQQLDRDRALGSSATQAAVGGGDAPPEDGIAIARTQRGSIEDEAGTLYMNLNIGGMSDRKESQIVRILLLNQDRQSSLISTYRTRHHGDLMEEINSKLSDTYVLRAHEYLTYGRLRAVAKLLLAMDGAGTSIEAVWRVLPDAHAEGDPVGKWAGLVSQSYAITRRWAGTTLDSALDDDMDGADLDKARALVTYGQLRPVDKIRVATNGAGTNTSMLFEGLRAADPATVATQYEAAYHESLETLLFDQFDEEGNRTSIGELSGGDADRARALFGTGNNNPDRLANLVQASVSGSNDPQMIWSAIEDARTRGAGTTDTARQFQAQLARLHDQVKDPADPLGLTGWGGLSDADMARLRALVGVPEGQGAPGLSHGLETEVLTDPAVIRLRALGGVDFDSVYDTLLKASPQDLAAFRGPFGGRDSPFSRYLRANTTVNSGQQGNLSTVISGSLYARLRLCNGGMGDDLEDYAYDLLEKHAGDTERRDLRAALRQIDNGESPTTPAGRAMQSLVDAFSTGEMGRVRTALQLTQLGVLEEAADMEASVERERSWWFGTTADLDDERRELGVGVQRAGLDGRLSAGEDTELAGMLRRNREALQGMIRVRDEYTGYAAQVVGVASGLLVAFLTGGAAAPAVLAAMARAAVASAAARVATEKALRGDRFDVMGGDGARAFLSGAVDGALSVVSGGAATGLMERVSGTVLRQAIEQGSATLGTRLVHSAISGTLEGGAGGVTDSVTQEDTWRNGVTSGLGRVMESAFTNAGTGALMSTGMAGAGEGGRSLLRRWRQRGVGPDGATTQAQADAPSTAHPDETSTTDRPPTTDGDAPARMSDQSAVDDAMSPLDGATTPTRVGLFEGHPLVSMVTEGNDLACGMLLDDLGPWETAIAHLQNGTGPAQGLPEAQRRQVVAALAAHRERIVAMAAGEPYLGRRLGNASDEPGSDVDLNLAGDDAGRRVIALRAHMDRYHPGWQRKYRMALLVDAGRVSGVQTHLQALDAPARAEAEARLTSESEVLLTARRVGHMEAGPERDAALAAITDPAVRARVEAMASLTPEQRVSAQNNALLESDALSARLRAATDPAERARLAEELSRTQMLANSMADDAYMTVGGIHGYAQNQRLTTPRQFYEAAIDQADMMLHQIHEHGSVLEAMRSYEMFKYMKRMCDTLEAAGVESPQLTFLRNWAELNYRVDRSAMGGPRDRIDPSRLSSKANTAEVRYQEPAFHQETPGVSDQFLIDNYNAFQAMVNEHLPRLRERATGTVGDPPSAVMLPEGRVPARPPRPPAAVDTPAVAAENTGGLGSDDALRRVADGVDTALATTARTGAPSEAHMRQVIDVVFGELDRIGVPRPRVVFADHPSPTVRGSYNAATNTLTVHPTSRVGTDAAAPLAFDLSTPAGVQRLTSTVMHESRHAEQAYQAMRWASMQNPTADAATLARQYGVHRSVAEAAIRDRFTAPDGSADQALGRSAFEARYDGPGRAARDAIVGRKQDIPELRSEVATLRTYARVLAATAGAEESLSNVLARIRNLNDQIELAYQAYRTMAHEVDAFSTGNRAGEYLRLRQAARSFLDRAATELRNADEMVAIVRRLAPGETAVAAARLVTAERVLEQAIRMNIDLMPAEAPATPGAAPPSSTGPGAGSPP